MDRVQPYHRPWNVLFFYTGTFRDGPILGAEIAETEFLKQIVARRCFRNVRIVTRLSGEKRQELGAFLELEGRQDVQLAPLRDLSAWAAAAPPDLAICPYAFQFQLDPIRLRSAFPIAGFVHTISDLEAKNGVARNLRMPDHHLDVALCPTRSVAKALGALAAELPHFGNSTLSTKLVPLGLDPKFLPSASDGERGRIRAGLGIAPDDVLFLYVGRLNPWTKMDLLPLLDAFALASRRSSVPLRLLIVGQEQASGYIGLLRARSDHLGIADRLSILDQTPREQLPALFGAADVFVSPSDNVQETFGLTLVEAMAAGLPVIAADWDGYADVLGADVGCLVPSVAVGGDEERANGLYYRGTVEIIAQMSQLAAISIPHLAEAFTTIAIDPMLRRRLALAARRRFEAHFSWDRVFEKLATIWDDQVAAAQAINSRARTRAQPELSINYGACFSHYPSRQWSDDARLSLSSGNSSEHDLLLAGIARAANIDWTRCLELRSRVAASGGSRIRDLLRPGESPAADRRCFLFLIKHGVIDVDWDALPSNQARGDQDILQDLGADRRSKTAQAGSDREERLHAWN